MGVFGQGAERSRQVYSLADRRLRRPRSLHQDPSYLRRCRRFFPGKLCRPQLFSFRNPGARHGCHPERNEPDQGASVWLRLLYLRPVQICGGIRTGQGRLHSGGRGQCRSGSHSHGYRQRTRPLSRGLRAVDPGECARARVVSMPSWELFDDQDRDYRESVLPPRVKARVSVEEASEFGWTKYTGTDGHNIGIETFGASAPLKQLLKKFGFTADHIVAAAKDQISRHAVTK